MPVEAYRGSVEATKELFRICRLMWHNERIPPEIERGMFVMLHKKGPRDDCRNYRAICLLCHSYKLMSAIMARRLMTTLEGHLPDTQAGFRPARGCRDNVYALEWFIQMILREGRQAVITFIDYSAAFNTESQMFLDEALSEAGVGAKVRRIVQAIFAAATGIVRLRQSDVTMTLSEAFDIARGVLQGDNFSPVTFIAGLDRIFRMYNLQNPVIAVGMGESTTIMAKFEYADDAAIVDADAATALLCQVYVSNTPLENLYSFEYRGARMQCDGDDKADVRHRMAIAQTTFGSLSTIWTDHRLSCAFKLRTYQLAVYSTLTHASEAWTLTEPVMRSVNEFNSRCLHIITGQDYRVTATAPEYDLLRAIRQRRLRYLGHILSMTESRVTIRAATLWTARQWRWTS